MDASRRRLFSPGLLGKALRGLQAEVTVAATEVLPAVSAPAVPDAASGLLSRRSFIQSMAALAALVALRA